MKNETTPLIGSGQSSSAPNTTPTLSVPIARHHTPSTSRIRTRSITITPPVQSTQGEQKRSKKSGGGGSSKSVPVPLNPASHHVRTSSGQKDQPPPPQRKKSSHHALYDYAGDEEDSAEEELERNRRKLHGFCDMGYLEKQLIDSIRLDEEMKLTINRRIATAIEKRILHVPVLAFVLVTNSERCYFVEDFNTQLAAKYEVELLAPPTPLNKEHLSLDLFHYEEDYRRVISIVIYLKSLNPPMRCVASRQPIALTPHPLELFPEEPGIQAPPSLPKSDDQSSAGTTLTTAITTTTTSNGETNTTTTTTRITHNGGGGVLESPRMVIPMVQSSAFDRLVYNVLRVRQTGYYYMFYVDLPLSIGTATKSSKTPSTTTNNNG